MRSKLRAIPFLLLLLPFDLILALCLFTFQIAAKSRRNLRQRGRIDNPPSARFVPGSPSLGALDLRATFVIVNWDGKHLLAECLPAVMEAVKFDSRPHEVLVVDNGSADGSAGFI